MGWVAWPNNKKRAYCVTWPDDIQNNLSERVLCNVVKQHTECSGSCVVRRDQIKCKMLKREACCVTWPNNVQHAPEESEMWDVPLQIHYMPYMLRSVEQGVICVLKFAVCMLRDVAKQCAKRVWKKACSVKRPREHQLIFSWRRLNKAARETILGCDWGLNDTNSYSFELLID